MKSVWIVFCIILMAASFACEQSADRATEPRHDGTPRAKIPPPPDLGKEGDGVSFSAYDADSRPLGEGEQIFPGLIKAPNGAATTWYCGTDGAFDYAVFNYDAGDVIYLTDDEEDYTLASGTTLDSLTINGTDTGRSVVDAGSWVKFQEATVTHVKIDNGILYTKDDVSLTDIWCDCLVVWSGGGHTVVSNSEVGCAAASATFGEYIDFYATDFYDATDYCDYKDEVAGNGITIHSWVYDDTVRSYDDHDITPIGVWWDTENNLVTFSARSEQYGTSGMLVYKIGGGCSGGFTGAGTVDVNGFPGGTTGTYHWVQISVSENDQRIYYKWKSYLCGTATDLTACTMKGKPRTSDGDIPPNPMQQ